MSKWVYVRLALVLFVGINSFFVSPDTQASPRMSLVDVIAIFVISPFALVAVIGFQAFNPRSAKNWTRPSWNENPFSFSNPLQFFHLGAYVFLSEGGVILLA